MVHGSQGTSNKLGDWRELNQRIGRCTIQRYSCFTFSKDTEEESDKLTRQEFGSQPIATTLSDPAIPVGQKTLYFPSLLIPVFDDARANVMPRGTEK
jgi:hypothetical protein